MKIRHPQWFFPIGLSSVVLQRYDGEIEKLDVTALDKQIEFPHWIAINAHKRVEQLT